MVVHGKRSLQRIFVSGYVAVRAVRDFGMEGIIDRRWEPGQDQDGGPRGIAEITEELPWKTRANSQPNS